MTFIVSALAGVFYLHGRFLIDFLRLPIVESNSIVISAGMAATAFFGWYASSLGIPVDRIITIVFFAALAILTLKSIGYLKYSIQGGKISLGNIPRTIYMLPIFALVFSAQAISAFKSPGHLVGTLGNIDIFYWSLRGDQLLGSTGLYNIFSGKSAIGVVGGIDAWGTYFILALVSKFVGKSALEATPYFTIFCLALIGFSIFEVIKKLFNFKDGVTFGVALLTAAGPFSLYIAYNNFYGQLLATFFYIATILAIFQTVDLSAKINFARQSVFYAFSLIGLLIVYQSAFFVFAIFSVGFFMTYGVFANFHRGSFAAAIKSTMFSLLPLLCGISLALILLPELTLHTAHRTISVADVNAGWPLPLIFPAYLLSIPVLTAFPELTGEAIHYFAALGVMIIVFIFAYSVYKRRDEEIPARFVAFVMFYCLSLAAYLLAYYAKGGTYQVWKFAAFVVLPMSFVFNAVLVLALDHSKIISGMFRKTLLFIFTCGCVVYVVIFPAKLKLESFSSKISQLRAAKPILHGYGTENVILAAPIGDTMAAFNVLSRDFRLFPLAQTYLPPADASLIGQLDPVKTRVLVAAKCYSDRPAGSIEDGFKITRVDELPDGKLFFSVNSADCAAIRRVHLIEGFSGAEPWGTWTEGNRARVEVNIPPALAGKGLEVSFEVHPLRVQSISVRANGHLSGSYVLKEPTTLKIDIPASLTERGKVDFDFYIDHPVRPKDVNPASDDPRLLGLGFVSFSMKASN